MLKRMTLCCVAGLMAVMTAGLTTRAQDIQSVDLPAEAKMIAQVDLQAMQASGFGKRLIEMMLDRVMEEVADRAGIGVPDINDVAGFLGFNPLEETRSITIAATDLENPESGVVGIIAMKKNIGSLEAMLPSVPGHSVKKSGGYDIHSLSPDGNTTVNLAIHTCGEGMKTLVVSASQDALTKQLARLEGKGEQCLNLSRCRERCLSSVAGDSHRKLGRWSPDDHRRHGQADFIPVDRKGQQAADALWAWWRLTTRMPNSWTRCCKAWYPWSKGKSPVSLKT